MSGLVIVGGGLAAVRAAQTARDNGFDGRVVLLTEEAETPYDRPPLSKEILLGTAPDELLMLLPPEDYDEKKIEVLLEHTATRIDTAAKLVEVQGKDPVPYDEVIVATGCRARRLDSIADGPDVHYLRTVGDARRLAEALTPGARVAIVGAGFIGLEVASAALARECSVTVLEAAPQPLTRALGPEVAAWLQDLHAAQGVTFRCEVTVESGTPGAPDERLILSDGSTIAADVIVIGIGITRDLEWLRESGLRVSEDGLICDADGRTSDAHVFGAGDIVCRQDARGAHPIQHWTAAGESAARAAKAALGIDLEPWRDEQFFWSNQAGLRLQSVGRYVPGAAMQVVHGALTDDSFVVEYQKDGELVGVFGVAAPRPFMQSRKILRDKLAQG